MCGQISFHLAVFADLGSCRSTVTGENEGDRDTWPWRRTEPHSPVSSAASNSSPRCREGKRCLTCSFPLGNNGLCVPCSWLSFIIFLENCRGKWLDNSNTLLKDELICRIAGELMLLGILEGDAGHLRAARSTLLRQWILHTEPPALNIFSLLI